MVKGFWQDLSQPIIGLAPMDGVTDAPFRYITAKHGRPDLLFTEFTSVEGLRAGALRLLDDFLYNPIERPIVAQLFGADPSAFYLGALVASALGFDGIDINMGCPAKNVTGHGAGAALINDPERAKAIIRQARAGTQAWSNGTSLEAAGLTTEMIALIKQRRNFLRLKETGSELPISVKTRLGYNQIVITEWVKHLLEANPVTITIHGRTLKQLYSGEANWQAIAEAASIIKKTETLVLGNGDVQNMADAKQKILDAGIDGVLIGRGSQGNPWIFKAIPVSFAERLEVILEHATYFEALFPPQAFVRMRKHLLDYLKGIERAKEIRFQLMKVSSLAETEAILLPLLERAR